MAYTSQYPPAQNSTYVKATSTFSSTWEIWFATDPAKDVNSDANNLWVSGNGNNTNQRIHLDLGSAKIIRNIYYVNGDLSGQTNGIKNFTFWGSNNAAAFAELTYGTDTNWTQITTAQGTFDEPNYSTKVFKSITATNSTAYQYYALKVADNYGYSGYITVRRIELQTEDGYSPPSTGVLPKRLLMGIGA